MGEFLKNDIVIIGISPDSQVSHQKFIDNNDIPFTLLSDPDKKMMTRYEAFGEKLMYGKLVTGVIRSTVWIGPDGKVVSLAARGRRLSEHLEKLLGPAKEATTVDPEAADGL